jgi:hypothetical protein
MLEGHEACPNAIKALNNMGFLLMETGDVSAHYAASIAPSRSCSMYLVMPFVITGIAYAIMS